MATISDYKNFIENFKKTYEKYEKKLEKLKKQGESDYNIFNALYSNSDEVRHTMFLQSFLDPEGLHYQGDLFLSEFVKACKIIDFELDTLNTRVYREYGDMHNKIDIYITDGNKHIIIENKIWASDQNKQIERYIDIIKKEIKQDYDKISDQDIFNKMLVLYLTPSKREPKNNSLGEYKIQGNFLVKANHKIQYKNITYEKEILEWIDKIKNKTENLNCKELFVLFCQYEKVIKNIVNKGDEMENAELKKLIRKNYETCIGIYNELDNVENEIVSEFLEYLYNALTISLKGSKTWKLQEYNKDNLVNYKKAKGVIDVIIIEHKKDDNKDKVIQIKKVDRVLDDIYLKCENGDISMKDIFNNEQLPVYLYNKRKNQQEKLANEMSLRIKEELDKSR